MLNWLLALGSAALLIFTFPKFSIVWFAPLALTPLLVAMAREPRWGRRFLLGWSAGVVYWFGVCYWIQFVLSFHGGLGEAAGWAVFLQYSTPETQPRRKRRSQRGSRAIATSRGASATGASQTRENPGNVRMRSAAEASASSQFSTAPAVLPG